MNQLQDRRRVARHSNPIPAVLDGASRAEILDLSASGARVMLRADEFYPQFELRFQFRGCLVHVVCEAGWCQSTGDHLVCGVRFHQASPGLERSLRKTAA
ncbi:MAG: PilZ domain-containing protein [Candidatus Eremiobacteraeota bacterium]|nr:PilZ domain-containing protein [Candidatus Eremiobacteraeota bacterium]